MACERHPLRCSIRLSPLQPPEIESLEFAVADAPKTERIVSVEAPTRIIADADKSGSEHSGLHGQGRAAKRRNSTFD
jgi:hypothetical protein